MQTYTLLFFFLIFNACSSEPEEVLILNHGEIYNELHQRNIGQVAFMGEWISFEEFKDSDKLTQLQLKGNSELSMRVFLEHTQTHYLHELAPDLTPNELCKIGNWQVRFYLDDELQYEENISPGAGSCSVRNDQTVIGIPLASPEQQDHWGWFLWTKFMKKGDGEKVLANGSHLLRLEIRPYIEQEELKVGELVAQGEIRLSKEQLEVSETEIVVQSIASHPDWEIDETAVDETTIRELNRQIAQRRFKALTSIVVLNEGKLVLEEYFNGAGRTSLHDTRSVGKSVASALLGIAIAENHIKNEDVGLAEIFDLEHYANPSKEKAAITLQQLLSMSSPLAASDMDADSPGQEEKMYVSDNWLNFVLGLPIDQTKVNNASFDYSSASSVLVGMVTEKNVPGGLEAYAQAKLFAPLGITNYQWQYTPQGIANTAGGLQMSSLDLAKFGQLYKNEGLWKERTIIPVGWINKSLSPIVGTQQEGSDGYGYFFWHNTIHYQGQDYPVAYASGNGGNRIMIFENLPIVVVITATAYGQAWAHFQADQIVEEYILPATID